MLTLTDISVRIAGRLLIEHASVTLPSGVKAGLVGRNGSGKTTLFNAIDGSLSLETGEIFHPRDMRLGRVLQEAPSTAESLISIVLKADHERTRLLNELETSKDGVRISEIQERLNDIDAFSAEARAATILAGLGFDNSAQQRTADTYSGGWRMRVALAALLFSRPDILLLDEPTNYLDLEGTLWLDQYIANYPGTVLVISHDRDLLNRSTNAIVHLENKKLKFYRGNYDGFERQRSEQLELEAKTRVKQQARAAHMQKFVDRFRYKASKAKQAQSRIKALEKMQIAAAHQETRVSPITFPEPEVVPTSPVIRLEGVSCGYAADKSILSRINLNIDSDDRIALLGANGNGKSTFAKLLTDRLPCQNGNIVKAGKLKIALFSQHQMDDLRELETPVDHFRALMPQAPEAKLRARVAAVGLGNERMDTKAKDLSGGEKARLLMGLIAFDAPNFLILDEPTNHLDIETREALAVALNDFKGAVILISHDRHLIDACVERLWIVRDGTVTPYEDDMDAYAKLVTSGRVAKSDPPPSTPGSTINQSKSLSDKRKTNAERRKQLAPLRKKITEAEALIVRCDEALSKIDTMLADPTLFSKNATQGAELMKKRAEIVARKETAEETWLALNEEYEGA